MCNRDVDVNPDRQTHRRLEAFEMWISKRMKKRSAGLIKLLMKKFSGK